jgi:hypothetical protein
VIGGYFSEQNVVLVVVAWRNVEIETKDLPENVIFLNKRELEILYTPSLASRPSFIEKHAAQ